MPQQLMRTLLVVLLLAIPLRAGAVSVNDLEARVYNDAAGNSLPYRLFKPKDYDPKQKYPLVLFLHGAGERGNDNAAQLRHSNPLIFVNEENQTKHPCFFVAPQCPRGKRWVEVDWGAAAHVQPKEPSDPMRLTIELLDALQKEFSLDPQRLYVTGMSMGGYGTWDIIARRPHLFAAAAIVCGGADETTAPRIAHIAQWAFHGAEDNVVKVQRSRNMIAALKQAGGTPLYTEYEKGGHGIWDRAYREPELVPWVFTQKRVNSAARETDTPGQ